MPTPRGILAISAHWYTRGVAVTAMEKPQTIHDFGGFPQALFDLQYPAPGDPNLATRVQELLRPLPVQLDHAWGLDHGVWSILVHMFPRANVSVVQLSIDATQPTRYHYDAGGKLAKLREEGVFVLGAGNVVHNLRAMQRTENAAPLPWAEEFNRNIRGCIERHDHASLIDYEEFGESARL